MTEGRFAVRAAGSTEAAGGCESAKADPPKSARIGVLALRLWALFFCNTGRHTSLSVDRCFV
jgi:hypothetical protein